MESVSGEIVGDRSYRVHEFATILGLGVDEVVTLVVDGVVEPVGVSPPDWLFPEVALLRAQRGLRLRRELAISSSALALVLDLIEELERLRRRVRDQTAPYRDVDC